LTRRIISVNKLGVIPVRVFYVRKFLIKFGVFLHAPILSLSSQYFFYECKDEVDPYCNPGSVFRSATKVLDQKPHDAG